MSTEEESPCPKCGSVHTLGPYGPRPDLVGLSNDAKRTLGPLAGIRPHGVPLAPPDVNCSCGALLRVCVPASLFEVDEHGWHWEIVQPSDNLLMPEG